MINNFGDIKLSEYRPTPRGLPVENILKSYDKLEARYDKNLMFSEQLQEKVDELNVESHNKEYLETAKDNLYNSLNTIVESGDLEYGEKGLMKAAKDFKNSDLLKESLESYAMFQQWKADIKERGLDIEDPDRINKWYQYYRQNAKKLERDENGNVINRFNLPRPVNNPKIAEQALDFLKSWQPDKIIGADIGNSTNVRSQMNISQTVRDRTGMYILGLSTEYKDGSEMTKAATEYILSKPENVAYLKEMLMLENATSKDIPIEDRLLNLGVTSYDILNDMTRQGVSKEEVFDNNILNYQSKLEELSKRASKIKANDTKDIEKYQKEYTELTNMLSVASDARLTSIVDEGEYQEELQRMYNGKYMIGLIEGGIKAAVESQDQVIQEATWHQDWRAKLNYEQALKDREVEESFKLDVGSSPSQTVQSLLLSVDGEGWEAAKKINRELLRLQELKNKNKTLNNNDQVRYDDLLSMQRNFKSSIVEIEKQLVEYGGLDKNLLDLAYKVYKREGGTDSREWFLARVINDKSHDLSNPGFTTVSNKNTTGDVPSQPSSMSISSTIVVTDPYKYAARSVGTNRGGLERAIDKAKKKLNNNNQATFTSVYNSLRVADKELFPYLSNANKALEIAAINGELNLVDNNMSLHHKLNELAKDGMISIGGNKVSDISGIKFNVELSSQLLPNGKVGAIVTVMNKDGTKYLQDKAGNPLKFVTYSPDNIQSYNLDNLYRTIALKSLKSRDATTREIGRIMIGEMELMRYLNPKGIIPELIPNNTNKSFVTYSPDGNTNNWNIRKEKDAYYILDKDGTKLRYSSNGQDFVLGSTNLPDLGIIFSEYRTLTGK